MEINPWQRKRSPSLRDGEHVCAWDHPRHKGGSRADIAWRARTYASVAVENIEKAVANISATKRASAAVRDISRYTLHGKFHREIYRIPTTIRERVSSRAHAEKMSVVNIDRRINAGNIAG